MTTTVKVIAHCDSKTDVRVSSLSRVDGKQVEQELAVMRRLEVQEFYCSPGVQILVEERPIPQVQSSRSPTESI